MISFALVFAVSSVFLVYCISTRIKMKIHKKLLPPGPHCNPPLCNLGQLAPGGEYNSKLAQWAYQYGKMFTLNLAGKTILVLNDANLMTQILSKMAATGRHELSKFNLLSWSGRHGIFQMEGNQWWEQKQFFVRVLTYYGFGRENRMENLVLAEADKLCGWIKTESGRVKQDKFFLNHVVLQITGNIVWSMLTGKITEEIHAPKLISLAVDWINTPVTMFKEGAPGYGKTRQLCREIQEFVEVQFREHRESRVDGEPPRDLIDAYIEKVEKCRDPASTFYGDKGWKNSYSNIVFITIASSDTLGDSIIWMLLCLSVHVQVQQELQREIDSVIGRDRAPSLTDKSRMPYMEAVILESLRFASLIPFGSTNTLLEDLEVDGYLLPKGTQILSNRHFVHYDKRIWGDPENFRPARFLEEGSDNLKKFVIPFHSGKRSCAGTPFAKSITFLIMAKLFQTFNFSVDPDVKNVEEYLEALPGHLRRPKDLAVVVRNRE